MPSPRSRKKPLNRLFTSTTGARSLYDIHAEPMEDFALLAISQPYDDSLPQSVLGRGCLHGQPSESRQAVRAAPSRTALKYQEAVVLGVDSPVHSPRRRSCSWYPTSVYLA